MVSGVIWTNERVLHCTSEVTISRSAWLDDVSLPAVHHAQVVEHRQVARGQLVLHTEVPVADRVEQLESEVNFSGGKFCLEMLGAPDLVVEADLFDVAGQVQLNSGSAEPLVKCRLLLAVLV